MSITETNIKSNIAKLADKYSTTVEEIDGKYSVKNEQLRLAVTLTPEWVGLVMDVSTESGEILNYSTDTDGYKVADYKESSFREAIAKDIEAVTSALLHDAVLVGKYKNKPSLIVPIHDEVVRIQNGRIITSVKTLDSVKAAISSGSFKPLKIRK